MENEIGNRPMSDPVGFWGYLGLHSKVPGQRGKWLMLAIDSTPVGMGHSSSRASTQSSLPKKHPPNFACLLCTTIADFDKVVCLPAAKGIP